MKDLEVKINELDDKVHEIDKQVSNINTKFDAHAKDHSELSDKVDNCQANCGARIANLENAVNGMWSKIIFALIGVIAAIVGADAAMKSFGHTPVLSHIGYFSTVFCIITMSLGMLYLALRRNGYSYWGIVASILVLIAGMNRIQEGYVQIGKVINFSIGIPLLLAGIVCWVEVIRKWLKRT